MPALTPGLVVAAGCVTLTATALAACGGTTYNERGPTDAAASSAAAGSTAPPATGGPTATTEPTDDETTPPEAAVDPAELDRLKAEVTAALSKKPLFSGAFPIASGDGAAVEAKGRVKVALACSGAAAAKVHLVAVKGSQESLLDRGTMQCTGRAKTLTVTVPAGRTLDLRMKELGTHDGTAAGAFAVARG